MSLPHDADSRFGLSGSEKAAVPLIYAGIAIATAFAFILSYLVGQVSVALAGLGIFSYTLGLRHGVDADHIAAIDNTTRKLMQENRRSLTVGLWFSLGHSTVVVALIVGLVIALRAVRSSISALQNTGAVIGLLVSGIFLMLIGLINVVITLGIYSVFKEVRAGHATMSRDELEELLNKRGFMNRFLRPLFKLVREPWQIYPIGVLFGLGFDTATEIAVIVITVTAGVQGAIPIWMILVLPLMFTCGMVLVDTTDGVTMRTAYGWAFLNPVRKIYYNLTVTLVSVVVAFGIGGIELLGVAATTLGLHGPIWDWAANLNENFESLGIAIIALFIVAWLCSVAYWKHKGYDKMFSPG